MSLFWFFVALAGVCIFCGWALSAIDRQRKQIAADRAAQAKAEAAYREVQRLHAAKVAEIVGAARASVAKERPVKAARASSVGKAAYAAPVAAAAASSSSSSSDSSYTPSSYTDYGSSWSDTSSSSSSDSGSSIDAGGGSFGGGGSDSTW